MLPRDFNPPVTITGLTLPTDIRWELLSCGINIQLQIVQIGRQKSLLSEKIRTFAR